MNDPASTHTQTPHTPPPDAPATLLPVTHLLYLHGFRSSPQSTKARIVEAAVRQRQAVGQALQWWCPQLPPSPAQAIAEVEAGIAGWPRERMGIIGSSLGGFYATVLAERLGCRTVLLNPSVDPARSLAAYVGEQQAWHSAERFEFLPRYVDELAALRPPRITDPQRYLLVAAKGDEVLNWRDMVARYPGCQLRLVEGSDHALSDFEAAHLPAVMAFLGI